MVPGRPAMSEPDAGGPPPGVQCADYPVCDPMGEGCASGNNCLALVGCSGPICIPAEEACELSCPDPMSCAIAESYPEQLSCPGRVEAHDEPSVEPFACGTAQCDRAQSYCYTVLPGVPDVEPSYNCSALPDECGGVATCACVGGPQGFVGPGSCSENDGAVTVTRAAP
jgi:hypothetical protein